MKGGVGTVKVWGDWDGMDLWVGLKGWGRVVGVVWDGWGWFMSLICACLIAFDCYSSSKYIFGYALA